MDAHNKHPTTAPSPAAQTIANSPLINIPCQRHRPCPSVLTAPICTSLASMLLPPNSRFTNGSRLLASSGTLPEHARVEEEHLSSGNLSTRASTLFSRPVQLAIARREGRHKTRPVAEPWPHLGWRAGRASRGPHQDWRSPLKLHFDTRSSRIFIWPF